MLVYKEIESSEAEEKTIVVYFSATGNTEQVAGVIAEATGGELFQLEPVEPYIDEDLDWTDKNSRVGKEHEDPEQREIELNRWLGSCVCGVCRLPFVLGNCSMASKQLC